MKKTKQWLFPEIMTQANPQKFQKQFHAGTILFLMNYTLGLYRHSEGSARRLVTASKPGELLLDV